MRIVGTSGVGKTALLEAALAAATDDWLVVPVSGHQIQASLPYFTARRMIRTALERLGDAASLYSSGLELDQEKPAAFEEAFFRALEGISLDRALLLSVDDAQWADTESRTLIERSIRALADRRIVLLSSERSEDVGATAFDFRDEAIALDTLDASSVARIASAIYPDATSEVIEAIVDRSGGRAVDVVTLSEGARDQRATSARDVDLSLRRTIARDLALLDPKAREFLQVCALIDDPIEFTLLSTLWPEEQLLRLIADVSGRFIVQRQDGLRFIHDAIKQGVRETVAIAIPIHRRIITAIKSQPSLRYEDYERIAEQAAACGDRELQRSTLVTLGDIAIKSGIFSLGANAWERALELGPPPKEALVAFYSTLSVTYNALSRGPENVRMCRAALEAAREAGTTESTAQLVASLVLAQAVGGNRASARADLERYRHGFAAPSDQAQMASLDLTLATFEGNDEHFEAALQSFQEVAGDAPPLVHVRIHTARAFIASRSGDSAQALAAIRMAEEACIGLPPAVKFMPMNAAALHNFMHRGPTHMDEMLKRRVDEQSLEVLNYLRVATLIAKGEFDDARTHCVESLVSQRSAHERRKILGLRATAAILSGVNETDEVWNDVLSDVAAFNTGDESPALVPIVTAWLAHESTVNPKRAAAVLSRALDASERIREPMLLVFPNLLVQAAKALNDRAALERIAGGGGYIRTGEPWSQAQADLACGLAAQALGDIPRSQRLLRDARDRFSELGVTFFATLTQATNDEKPSAANLRDGRFGITTRREREIAGLVADGLTNREIAEKLVLSERTVEGHVANLFNKLEVSSRTQVAAWYLRATSSVA